MSLQKSRSALLRALCFLRSYPGGCTRLERGGLTASLPAAWIIWRVASLLSARSAPTALPSLACEHLGKQLFTHGRVARLPAWAAPATGSRCGRGKARLQRPGGGWSCAQSRPGPAAAGKRPQTCAHGAPLRWKQPLCVHPLRWTQLHGTANALCTLPRILNNSQCS